MKGLVSIIDIPPQCTPEGTLGISVNEIDNGVMIENSGNIDCLVFVNSPKGEQQFELAVDEIATFTNISQPTNVSTVSQ